MGRTYRNYKDEEELSYSKTKKFSKHSRNEPGKGMRILNEYEDDYEQDDHEDFEEYNVNTTQYYATRGN